MLQTVEENTFSRYLSVYSTASSKAVLCRGNATAFLFIFLRQAVEGKIRKVKKKENWKSEAA
jgi:hypothetical protein